MADKCYNCDRIAYDDCGRCRRPACKVHGRQIGDEFRCNECGFKDTAVAAPEFTSVPVNIQFLFKFSALGSRTEHKKVDSAEVPCLPRVA